MFKLVCGAGNEDCESVKRLVYVYAKAGCDCFDISARREILEAAKSAAEAAGLFSPRFCVSIGIKGDKHLRKAEIQSGICTGCGICRKVCPNDAVSSSFVVNTPRCIGCGICAENCPTGAVRMYEKDIDIKEILPYMVQNGVEMLELHINGQNKEDLDYKWKIINDCEPEYASICVDRENFGNKEILERIKEMISIRKPYTTIVQADGIPMSGTNDDYKTTLQAAATAEIVQNANLPVYIVLSGGTNSKTAELARLCGINYWGIAMGSWARKTVKPYTSTHDFWENEAVRKTAVKLAQELINTTLYLS